MQANNEEKFKKLDETLKDAEENLGETEIRDALYAKAEYLCQIGDKVCTDNSFDFVSVSRIKTPYDYYLSSLMRWVDALRVLLLCCDDYFNIF